MPRNLKKEREWAKGKYSRILADIDKELATELKLKLSAEKKSIASWISENAKAYLANEQKQKKTRLCFAKPSLSFYNFLL